MSPQGIISPAEDSIHRRLRCCCAYSSSSNQSYFFPQVDELRKEQAFSVPFLYREF
jgi:hypothetical protein